MDSPAVDEAYARGRRRWPDLALDSATFRKHVERLRLDAQRLAARAEDMFLVAAVLDNVPRALSCFEEPLAQGVAFATRVDSAPAFVADVKQEVRVLLLTGETPKLATYSGAGGLVDWLRVVAVRAALALKRADRLHPTADVPEVAVNDHEAAQLKQRYLDDFRRALEGGFQKLTPRERTLLRLHFVDGLNIERMGEMYGVHRATVARWLVTIRQNLFEDAKGTLATLHGLDTADLRSLYRLMEDDVHITISRILKSGRQ